MEPQVRFCTTSDGVRIAYAVVGEGPPLVVANGCWLSTAHDLDDRFGGSFYRALAERNTVVCYDRRGTGLSDRNRTDFTFEADASDLEALVSHLGLERFALVGNCALGHAAIAYAARHPKGLTRLILYATWAHGPSMTRDEIKTSMISMARSHWGMASRTIADMLVPATEGETVERIAHAMRESCAGAVAANFLQMMYTTDVTALLPAVNVPTLVLHRQHDRGVPFRMARELSSRLPNARLVSLEGMIHLLWYGDYNPAVGAIHEFLKEEESAERPMRAREGPVTILFTDIESSTELTQRLGDARAQELVRAHNAIVREALKAHGGSEIKHTGDGIMASFASASGALACAVAIQQAVVALRQAQGEHAQPVEAPLAVHIGLNAGEPVAEENDLYGTSVQLARRICDQANGGEVLVSDVVRQLVAGKGFLFADRGDVALRGFEDPVRLYEVRWRDDG